MSELKIEEFKRAEDHELKVKVAWAGICGSDLHEYDHGPIFIPVEGSDPITGGQAPLILGHEFSGVVEEVGSSVKDVQVGDRISIYPIITKGLKDSKEDMFDGFSCLGLHLDGGFADYAIIPEKHAYKLPEAIVIGGREL